MSAVVVGKREGVQTTVTRRAGTSSVEDTSGSVNWEGWVVRGRGAEILIVTSLRVGPLDDSTWTYITKV